MPYTSVNRQLFCHEINKPEPELSLERAALYIALEEYPALDVEYYLRKVDEMAVAVGEHIPLNASAFDVVGSINYHLFEHLGYMGTVMHSYNPIAIHLNEVLDRQVGTPTTLSLIYLAIAQRIEFPMVGVGLPGHLLIRPQDSSADFWVDPFHRGAILNRQDCQFRLLETFRQPVELKDDYLKPLSPRQILARLLSNLKTAYLNAGNLHKAVTALDRILLLFPDQATEVRDRGTLNYQLNRFSESQQDLERYLKLEPNAEDASLIQAMLNTIQ